MKSTFTAVLLMPLILAAACNAAVESSSDSNKPNAAALPPKYLEVSDFQRCLGKESHGTYTTWCLPSERPETCVSASWQALVKLQGKDAVPSCTVATDSASDAHPMIVTFISSSNEKVIASYEGSGDSVTLTFANGTKLTLPVAMSGSGARFERGGHEWWEHQGEATYTVNEQRQFVGKLLEK